MQKNSKLNNSGSTGEIPRFARNDSSLYYVREGKGQAKPALFPPFFPIKTLVIPNKVRNLFSVFLIFDVYLLVQSLSTSWIYNRLIINMKKGKKKYFSKSGLQTLDNQHCFFSCKRVGKKHTDNQAQYRGFVNDLGLNKKSVMFTFLISDFYFLVQSLTTCCFCNSLIISMKIARKKTDVVRGSQLTDYQAQFLGLTTFDNL